MLRVGQRNEIEYLADSNINREQRSTSPFLGRVKLKASPSRVPMKDVESKNNLLKIMVPLHHFNCMIFVKKEFKCTYKPRIKPDRIILKTLVSKQFSQPQDFMGKLMMNTFNTLMNQTQSSNHILLNYRPNSYTHLKYSLNYLYSHMIPCTLPKPHYNLSCLNLGISGISKLDQISNVLNEKNFSSM